MDERADHSARRYGGYRYPPGEGDSLGPNVATVAGAIERQRYHIVDQEPNDAARMQHPKARPPQERRSHGSLLHRTRVQRVTQALAGMCGAQPVRIRTMGGTVPIAPFIRELGLPAVQCRS